MAGKDLFLLDPARIEALPLLACHDKVTVRPDLPAGWEPGQCGICAEPRSWEDREVLDGCMRVEHARMPGDLPRPTDVCGTGHAEQELSEVLFLREWWPLIVVTLRVPETWAVWHAAGRAA